MEYKVFQAIQISLHSGPFQGMNTWAPKMRQGII